ncbi:hypothetical protein COU61_02705 [Candidatus Pacearchaeota archaeon CG10_big_fil_rev_8_21_14_0_10_35_13]|nr:MAG: hypothetical protein COU61_02705 [Candidatus Pacearchaeota archaeon CG10_big_fil_rev_8_21_14_0_10_35_13]
MGSANAGPEYAAAEKKYFNAESLDDKIVCLDDMIRTCPKHKSSEKMLAELKTRKIKLLAKLDKLKKSGKSSRKGIRKDGPQAVLIGFSNSGKSSILNALSNASPLIANYKFSTKAPVIGTLDINNVKVQLIDLPAVDSEFFDKSLANTADLLLLVVTSFSEISQLEPFLVNSSGKRLIIMNKSDLLTLDDQRRLDSKLRTNKLNFLFFSTKVFDPSVINSLKSRILEQFDIMRVFTKEPSKKEHSGIPVIMKPGSTVEDIANKIHKGLISDIKEIRIWGPSSKFSGQKVGLKHVLKDLDVVEFKTR